MEVTALVGIAVSVIVAKSLRSMTRKASSTSHINLKGDRLLLVVPVNLCENDDFVEACLILQMYVLPLRFWWQSAWKNL